MNYRQKPKHEKIHNLCFRFLLLSVAAAVVYGILLYSNNIRLANALREAEQAVELLDNEIANATSELYGITDFADLETVVLELGLVREFNPDYLNINDQLTYR
ncbi:MAG: hypothetical protein Q8Q32_02565 [bacterium]|nr:hypothetical protein [bacterium]